MEKRTMSVEDVAIYLGLHKDTIYDLVKEKKIPHIKIGGRIFFLEEVLERWMLENIR
ncbi:helix-turn-helix domain-containing protein [Oceanobacillus chungangensis]|uniref:DNA-binding protein n=1 Tax=Oceanobacillus chungangensis TaxID=1229152 RepID=A0A3D8PU75_9BACI|nr:helix-turn-helix domain-containing protein [Oceanobacillus chungangensis]RDW19673.1 DNA-binding protein [Oceanobacillus chungangensis]